VEIPDGGSAIPVFHDSRGRDISALLAIVEESRRMTGWHSRQESALPFPPGPPNPALRHEAWGGVVLTAV
jgi:hypothetical protein